MFSLNTAFWPHLGLISFSSCQYFDLAADVLAENAHLTYKFLTPVRDVIRMEFHAGRRDDTLGSHRFSPSGSNLLFFFVFQYIYEFLDALLMSQTTPEEVW